MRWTFMLIWKGKRWMSDVVCGFIVLLNFTSDFAFLRRRNHLGQLLSTIIHIQEWERTLQLQNYTLFLQSQQGFGTGLKTNALWGGGNNGKAFCYVVLRVLGVPSGWPPPCRMLGRGLSGWMATSPLRPPLFRQTHSRHVCGMLFYLSAARSKDEASRRRRSCLTSG